MIIQKTDRIGAAAEYLVCYDLAIQGFNVSMAAAGLPYDVIMEMNTQLYRVQVKSRSKGKGLDNQSYAFPVKDLRKKEKRIKKHVDYFAFVALDIKKIAYVPIVELFNQEGSLYQAISFQNKKHPQIKHPDDKLELVYTSVRFFEDYSRIKKSKRRNIEDIDMLPFHKKWRKESGLNIC